MNKELEHWIDLVIEASEYERHWQQPFYDTLGVEDRQLIQNRKTELYGPGFYVAPYGKPRKRGVSEVVRIDGTENTE